MSKFDVFDELGNKVGEFVPSGEDGEGLFGCLLIVALFVVGLPIYGLVWLVNKGLKAVQEGDKGKALSYLALPSFLVVFIGCALLSNWVNDNAQQRAYQVEHAHAVATAEDEVRQRLLSRVKIENVRRVASEESDGSSGKRDVIIRFTVTEFSLSISSNECGDMTYGGECEMLDPSLEVTEDGRLELKDGYTEPLSQVCITVHLAHVWQYDNVNAVVCNDISDELAPQ